MLWTEVSARWDKWVANNNGYTRLRNSKISRGCQTMLDRPILAPARRTVSQSRVAADDLVTADTSLSRLSLDGDKEMRMFEKRLQYDRDVADYIAYLDRPVINLNDHYIEIHQYHLEPPVRPPTRRRRHRIDLQKTEIVQAHGLEASSSFLGGGATPTASAPSMPATNTDVNRNLRFVIGRTSDEENRPEEAAMEADAEAADRHRALCQVPRVRRGRTFTAAGLAPEASSLGAALSASCRGRKDRKGRHRRREAVAVGERGVDGPIWPAVLLTFDRERALRRPNTPGESEV